MRQTILGVAVLAAASALGAGYITSVRLPDGTTKTFQDEGARQEIQGILSQKYLKPESVRAGNNVFVTTNAAGEVTISAVTGTEPDFTTNNTVLVETIEEVAPTPGNYAAVSNAAMNAATRSDLDAATETNAAQSAQMAMLAPIFSPSFSGTPTAPTPSVEDNTTKIATTEFVRSVVESAISPVRSTANSASSGVSSLNTRMNIVEDTISSLKPVATSGKYSDLTGNPTKVSDFTNDEGYVKASEITQEYLQDKGMATQQSLDDVKDSVEFIVPQDLSHVVDADLNIYSVSSTVDYVISAPIVGGTTETAWKRLRDSNGNTYTCKSSYNLNASPSYVYFRYSRDGDSQTLVNFEGNPADSTYTNGIVIIKRVIYNQYQLAVYGSTANLVGSTADTFAKSVLDEVDGHVTVQGVNYYAKRNIFKGSEVLDRLTTSNDVRSVMVEVNNQIENKKVDRLYDDVLENRIAHYQLNQEPYSTGSHTSDEYIYFEFDIVWTNYTTAVQSGKSIRTYPAVNMTHISGKNVAGHATYYWNETDKLGWWNLWTGYSSVSTDTVKKDYLSPYSMFTTNVNWSISANDTYNEVYQTVTLLSKREASWNQYVRGDLGIYDSQNVRTGSLVAADTDGVVKFSDWSSIVKTNSTETAQTLTSYVGSVVSDNDFQMVSAAKSTSGSTATYTLTDKAYNYATQDGETSVNFSFPASIGKARVFYFVYDCSTAGATVTVSATGCTFYIPPDQTDYLVPTQGLTIYRFEEVDTNKFSITVSHRVELQ